MHSLDIRSNGSGINDTIIDPDIVGRVDDDKNRTVLLHDLSFIVVGTIDLQAGLANKRRGDDEEDQHDEHHVQHRREIDLGLVIFAF